MMTDEYRQLAADRSWIATTGGNLDFRLHRPLPRERVEGMWGNPERDCYRYMTVFRDGSRFRMYYALVDTPHARHETKQPDRICHAESADGIHWEHPALGLYEDHGSRSNPIVWMEREGESFGVRGFSPFRDDAPGVAPEHRYKAVAQVGPVGAAKFGGNGLAAISSPDGLHWSMFSQALIMTGSPGIGGYDSQNLAFWDACHEVYRLYWRVVYREGPRHVFRDILTATSADFLNWSAPRRLGYPGAPPEELYTNNIQPYFRAPHLLIGFPVRYVERPWSEAIADLPERERREHLIRTNPGQPTKDDPTGAGGQRIGTALSDALFMISTDGVQFARSEDAFFRPGLRKQDNWFYGDNFPAWGVLPTTSGLDGTQELSFYVTEGERQPGRLNRCRRHALRMDGFVSASAGRSGGTLTSVPMEVKGTGLEVNFSASAAGSVRIGLLDEAGELLPGFEPENQIELLGDDLARAARWKDGASLATLKGRRVRIRFHLLEADLYSWSFVDGTA